jgi:hypothetical protein
VVVVGGAVEVVGDGSVVVEPGIVVGADVDGDVVDGTVEDGAVEDGAVVVGWVVGGSTYEELVVGGGGAGSAGRVAGPMVARAGVVVAVETRFDGPVVTDVGVVATVVVGVVVLGTVTGGWVVTGVAVGTSIDFGSVVDEAVVGGFDLDDEAVERVGVDSGRSLRVRSATVSSGAGDDATWCRPMAAASASRTAAASLARRRGGVLPSDRGAAVAAVKGRKSVVDGGTHRPSARRRQPGGAVMGPAATSGWVSGGYQRASSACHQPSTSVSLIARPPRRLSVPGVPGHRAARGLSVGPASAWGKGGRAPFGSMCRQ